MAIIRGRVAKIRQLQRKDCSSLLVDAAATQPSKLWAAPTTSSLDKAAALPITVASSPALVM